jgi:hypothetical protein
LRSRVGTLQLSSGAMDSSALSHNGESAFQRRKQMAKTSGTRSSTRRPRPTDKRDLVSRPKASSYAKRTARGRFKEMDDVTRSQAADKPRKAKRTVRSGYGDQGDRPPRRNGSRR